MNAMKRNTIDSDDDHRDLFLGLLWKFVEFYVNQAFRIHYHN